MHSINPMEMDTELMRVDRETNSKKQDIGEESWCEEFVFFFFFFLQ